MTKKKRIGACVWGEGRGGCCTFRVETANALSTNTKRPCNMWQRPRPVYMTPLRGPVLNGGLTVGTSGAPRRASLRRFFPRPTPGPWPWIQPLFPDATFRIARVISPLKAGYR